MNKRCTRCGRELPATLDIFDSPCPTARWFGRSRCRECVRASLNAWRAEHPALVKEQQDAYHRRAKKRRFAQKLEELS